MVRLSHDSGEQIPVGEIEVLRPRKWDCYSVSFLVEKIDQKGHQNSNSFRWFVWDDKIEIGSVSAMLLTPDFSPRNRTWQKFLLVYYRKFQELKESLPSVLKDCLEECDLNDLTFSPQTLFSESILEITPELQVSSLSKLHSNIKDVSKDTFDRYEKETDQYPSLGEFEKKSTKGMDIKMGDIEGDKSYLNFHDDGRIYNQSIRTEAFGYKWIVDDD